MRTRESVVLFWFGGGVMRRGVGRKSRCSRFNRARVHPSYVNASGLRSPAMLRRECELNKVPCRRTNVAILDIRSKRRCCCIRKRSNGRKLKGKDFFDAGRRPLIRFSFDERVQDGPETVESRCQFTIRGSDPAGKAEFTMRAGDSARQRSRERWPFDRSSTGE